MGKTTSKGIMSVVLECACLIQNYMYASGLLQVSQCSARNAASLKELMSYLQTLLHTSKRRDEVMRTIEENILKDFVEL